MLTCAWCDDGIVAWWHGGMVDGDDVPRISKGPWSKPKIILQNAKKPTQNQSGWDCYVTNPYVCVSLLLLEQCYRSGLKRKEPC